jgi:DNA-directed RNA polymerase subunit M/transcription elongation factor TFIIS
MPQRNYVDDFRNDGGVPPRQSLRAGDTTTHVDVSITCTRCAYSWTPRLPNGSNKKVKIQCPNCGYETATGL